MLANIIEIKQNIYHLEISKIECVLRSHLRTFNCQMFTQKYSILDVWRGSEIAYVYIVPSNVLCHHNKHLIECFEVLHNSRIICLWVFQKNRIDNIFKKLKEAKTDLLHLYFNTTQYQHTLKNNIYHSN